MSTDEIHAILRAPRKIIMAFLTLVVGGGVLSISFSPDGGVSAQLAECRSVVEEHAGTIEKLQSGAEPALRRLESFPGDVSSMLGRGRE